MLLLFRQNLIKLRVPLNFILDTGSGAISLDSSTAAEFNIPHVPSGRTINGIAGIREVDFTQNKQTYFSGAYGRQP